MDKTRERPHWTYVRLRLEKTLLLALMVSILNYLGCTTTNPPTIAHAPISPAEFLEAKQAVLDGDSQMIIDILETKPELAIAKDDENGFTLLDVAVVKNNTPIASILIDNGADINTRIVLDGHHYIKLLFITTSKQRHYWPSKKPMLMHRETVE